MATTENQIETVDLAALTEIEEEELIVCESEIEHGIEGFRDTVRALAQIKNHGLWRGKYLTFEDYCDKRWNFSRQHVYRLIQAADVLENIPIANERQARALTRYTKSFQEVVWLLAEETTPLKINGKPHVTASHIASLVEVTKDLLLSQVMADSVGDAHPIGFFFDLNVTEHEREHLLRQKEHIRQEIKAREERKRENGSQSPPGAPSDRTGTQQPSEGGSPAESTKQVAPATPEVKVRLLLRTLATWVAGEDNEIADRQTKIHPALFAVYHFSKVLLGQEKHDETEMRQLGSSRVDECDVCGAIETQVVDWIFTNSSTQRLSSAKLALCEGCAENYNALNEMAQGVKA